MTPTEIHFQTRAYIACHACGHKDGMYIGHLLEDVKNKLRGDVPFRFGPWYCDQCGASTQGEVRTDGTVHVEPGRMRKEERAVLLKHQTAMEDPIYLIVKGMRFIDPEKPETDEEHAGHHRFFYEESSCPLNHLRSALAVIEGSPGDADDDPHGLFTYVADVPLVGNEEVLGEGNTSVSGNGEALFKLFGVS